MDALHTILLFALMCLGQNVLGSEIINGEKAEETSMLYMASLQNKARHHICGGFLVNENFVMTAAHCDDGKPTSIVLGAHNLKKVNDKKMRYNIIKRCKHPRYHEAGSGNDIMLLKVPRNARPGGKKLIKPIQLPSHQVNLKENTKCRVAGWGKIKIDGETVDDLRVVDVPIINQEKCQTQWGNSLPPKVICAGGYPSNKGFCQGDSGGPLVWKGNVAVGIVSFNNGSFCNYPDVPNIYTEISKFLPWIKDVLMGKQC
ncbi:duodenase-1-like [Pholidichthys leucotaenia]